MFRGSVNGTGYRLHLASFPFTSPPVRHRVPWHFNWSLRHFTKHRSVSLCSSRIWLRQCDKPGTRTFPRELIVTVWLFLNVTPCGLLEIHLPFGGTCRLDLQDVIFVNRHMIIIVMSTAEMTSNQLLAPFVHFWSFPRELIVTAWLFLNVTPCGLLEIHLPFGGTCRLDLQDVRFVNRNMIIIVMSTAEMTSNQLLAPFVHFWSTPQAWWIA